MRLALCGERAVAPANDAPTPNHQAHGTCVEWVADSFTGVAGVYAYTAVVRLYAAVCALIYIYTSHTSASLRCLLSQISPCSLSHSRSRSKPLPCSACTSPHCSSLSDEGETRSEIAKNSETTSRCLGPCRHAQLRRCSRPIADNPTVQNRMRFAVSAKLICPLCDRHQWGQKFSEWLGRGLLKRPQAFSSSAVKS